MPWLAGDTTAAPMQTPQRHPARARKRSDRSLPTLRDLLGAVASTRGTRFELVCWHLNVEESRARPAWDVALRVGLLENAGVDPLTGQVMYRLGDRGRDALRELSRGPGARNRAA
jgi:hypothetical protein